MGMEKVSLETFSIFEVDSVPIFAPKMLMPTFAVPSVPDWSDAVTATSNFKRSIGADFPLTNISVP